MKRVTDPALLEALNGAAPAAQPPSAQPRSQPAFIPTLNVGTRGVSIGIDPTRRQEEDKPLSPTELEKFRSPEGSYPPPGATLRDVQSGGYQVQSSDLEKLQISQQGANAVLDRLDTLVDNVFPTGHIIDRLQKAPGLMYELYAQDDPNVALYQSLYRGTLAPIIRALGEKGTLAEGDVRRAIELMPKLLPFPDKKEVAKQKLQQIRDILQKASGKESGQTTQTPQTPTKEIKFLGFE